jgi:hypothetical protein
MPATFKSFQTALNDAIRDIASRWDDPDVSDGSLFDSLASMFVAQRMGATSAANQYYNSLRPDIATGGELDALAAMYGITRNEASKAYGLTASVTVDNSGTWDKVLKFTTETGLEFEALHGGEWTAAGSETVNLISVSTGNQANLPSGTELTITAPPANMEETATLGLVSLYASYEQARDAETDAQLQHRLADIYGGAASAGNAQWFHRMVLSDECAAELAAVGLPAPQECFVYPGARSVYDISVVPVMAWTGIQKRSRGNVYGSPSTTTVIGNFLSDNAPGLFDIGVVSCTEQSENIWITLDTDAEWGRDWGTAASSSATTDASGNHTDTRLYLTGNPPMSEEDRIIFHAGANFYPIVRTVVATDSASDFIEVDEAITNETGQPLSGALLNNLTIRPGGPVAQAVIDNILGLFAVMTPGDMPFTPLTGASCRWPPIDKNHPTDLSLAAISHAALSASEHVLDVSISIPATTQTPTASSTNLGNLVSYLISPNRANDWCRVYFNQLNS